MESTHHNSRECIQVDSGDFFRSSNDPWSVVRGVLIVKLLILMMLSLASCGNVPLGGTASNIDPETTARITSVAASNNETLWIIVHGNLLRISNGEQYQTDLGHKLVLVTFLNATHGWVVDQKSQIWRTTDGGNSWQTIFTPPSNESGFYLPQQLTFIDEQNGWLLGIFDLWRTVDGGKTWKNQFATSKSPEPRVGRLYRGSFADENSALITSSGGVVIGSQDAGATWKHTLGDKTDFHDVAFVNEKIGWLVGRPNGGIYLTEDGGNTWYKRWSAPDTFLNAIGFADQTKGWAGGWRAPLNDGSREAFVVHTSDGGRTWAPQQIDESERFIERIVFYDSSHGWLIGRDKIYYTKDGGLSWKVVYRTV